MDLSVFYSDTSLGKPGALVNSSADEQSVCFDRASWVSLLPVTLTKDK